jgi:hypothetical protein
VLDEHPAVAVHDRLGQPCGPGGEQDIERVLERDALERERSRLGEQVAPAQGVGRVVRPVRDPHHMLDGWQRGADGGELVAPVDRPVAVAVATDGEQHLGLDLREAPDYAPRAELRRARGPHRAEARGSRERHERLVRVGQVPHDAVAATDAEALEARPGARDLVGQLREGQIHGRAGLRALDHRDTVGVLRQAEHVLGVVEARAGEPARAGHGVVGQDTIGPGRRADAIEVPDRAPEALEIVDRPAPQRVVVVEAPPALVAQPVEEPPELGGFADVGGRRPEQISLSHGP